MKKNNGKKVLKQEVNKTINWGTEAEIEMTQEEAKKWCEEQGGRLPTMIELLCACEDEEIRKTFQTSSYWSSTENYSTNAYYVYFSNCSTDSNFKSLSYYVRCVYDN